MLYEIKNETLRVAVGDLGAELRHINGNDGTEYLWQGDTRSWEGRAPNLFPVCGRLNGGAYLHCGRIYGMGLHGFARERRFSLLEQKSNLISLALVGDDDTRKRYPFDFTLEISYRLERNTLCCLMSVVNTGDATLPFSIGGHPGFNIPLTPGGLFKDYFLEFDQVCAPRRLVLSESGFLTGDAEPYELEGGRILHLSHSLFERDGIFLTDTSPAVTLKSGKGEREIRLECRDMSCLGFWQTAKSDAPFLCIEPWRGFPDLLGPVGDIMLKPGMTHLERGERYDFRYDISLS